MSGAARDLTHPIRVQNVSRAYGRGQGAEYALREVSLEIEPGEFVSIMGTSGSGKTTLLNLIGGLDTHFTGSIEIGGHRIEALSDRALSRLRSAHMGFVFQQFHLLDHMTSLENVALPQVFDHDRRSEASQRARARALLDRVRLGDKMGAYPGELSGGQKQRVAIARALLNQPSLLLCDEPTGSLDRQTGVQILDIFRHLNAEEGLTIVMVTHEAHIAQMASREIRLEDGVLVSDARRAPVFSSSQESPS